NRQARIHFFTIAGLATVFLMPFVYRSLALYADRRSQLQIELFQLPQRMLIKLDLQDMLTTTFSRLAPTALRIPLLLAAATALFLAVGIGLRWIGVPGIWRAIRGKAAADGDAWRLLAWTAVTGVVVPFVLVAEPYNDTLQFYQTGLYVMWIF